MARDVIMPALGMAQKTGSIVRWRKQPGEAVKAGDVLMEVETDKTVMEVEAGADGILTDVRAAAGEEIPVGEVIAKIADGRADAPAPPARNELARMAPIEASQPPSAVHDSPAAPPQKRDRVFASPRARRLAAKEGLDLARLARAGEPQPYLVKHLAMLRGVVGGERPPPEATTPALRLTATVAGDRLAEFFAWRRAETGEDTDELAVIAAMAAAAYRPGAANAPFVVAAEAFGRTRGFLDPDRVGLGAAQASGSSSAPALILRDLRAASIVELRLGHEAAPALTVLRRGAELMVTLECAPWQLRPDAAIALLSEFAGRLAEPLRHLL